MVNHVCIVSGGMDSFTLLHKVLYDTREALKHGDTLTAISFDYNQRHRKELEYARQFTKHLGIKHILVPLGFLQPLLRGSSLTDANVATPIGHYQAESMKQTVVPGRNTIMLSVAMGIAEGMEGEGIVYYGAHAGDHHIYPDCRPEYVSAMMRLFEHATDARIALEAPFIHQTKADILRTGLGHGLNYDQTWTCYEGGDIACGKCGACTERLLAFDECGAEDPLVYQDRHSYKLNAA